MAPLVLNQQVHNEIARLAKVKQLDAKILEEFAYFVIEISREKSSLISKPLNTDKLKQAVYERFDVQNTRELSQSGAFKMATNEKSISEDFHQWNGGNKKPCTIDDFLEYIEWRYPQKHETILMLYNRRVVLLLKLRQLQRALPEGNS